MPPIDGGRISLKDGEEMQVLEEEETAAEEAKSVPEPKPIVHERDDIEEDPYARGAIIWVAALPLVRLKETMI